jgi:hypothetical protein
VRRSCDAVKIEIKFGQWRLGSNRYKSGYFGVYGGVWRKHEVRSQAVRFLLVKSGFSCREDVFTLNLL